MNDNEMIKDCIQLYFDGCYESDPEKIKASFNLNASITGYLPDGFHEMSVDDFADFVASQQNWKCGKCNTQLAATFEVDHKLDLQFGGTNHVNNLVALCRNCHGEKGMMHKL